MDIELSCYVHSESEHALCVNISVDELCCGGDGQCREREREERALELATSLVEAHTAGKTVE